MLRLKSVKLLRERVIRWDEYPFNIPPIASLDALQITSRICFFAGENGTGKSTLLEAIAAHYGFGREGGNRNFFNARPKAIIPSIHWSRHYVCRSTGGPVLDFSFGRKASSTAPHT